MWTFVTVTFSSEGAKSSEIHRTMIEMGFKPTLGNYDYAYRWEEKDVPKEKISEFIETKLTKLVDEVQAKLKGKNVLLHFRTFKYLK